MNWISEIEAFTPCSEQEARDKEIILKYSRTHAGTVLLRSDPIAHCTSSAFILNKEQTKVLMIFHKIRNSWSWPGGHADGNEDLLAAALQEASEETGLSDLSPLTRDIASLDIFPVESHRKRGRYVNPHLHFSVGYLLTADENTPLRFCPEEAAAAKWISIKEIHSKNFSQSDVLLYQKLLARAKAFK